MPPLCWPEPGVPAAEAARVLAARFGVSARQARRYADQARASGRAQVPEANVVFTVKLPARPRGCGREHAREGGTHDLRCRDARADRVSGAGPQEQSPQVSDRAVEAEFVFGRRVRDTFVGVPHLGRL